MQTHRPPHINQDEVIYFLTVRCFHGGSYFQDKQSLVLKIINLIVQRFDYGIYAWVILNNHFHLLLKVKKDFAKFIQNLNGRISFEINKLDRSRGRQIVYQYWDHCITSEADFWKHFNYIHHNPVKHGYCQNETEVFGYPFSSARQWVNIKGKEWVDSCFEMYPIIDFTVSE